MIHTFTLHVDSQGNSGLGGSHEYFTIKKSCFVQNSKRVVISTNSDF